MRLLTLLLASLLAAAAPAQSTPPEAGAYLARKDVAGLRQALAGWLVAREAQLGDAAAGLARAEAEPAYRQALAAHEVLRVSGDEAVAGVLAKPDGPAFLRALLADTAWMEEYVGTGWELKPGQGGLDILRRLHGLDTGADRQRRSLMAALAVTYSATSYAENLTRMADSPAFRSTPEARYKLYREAQQAGFLHRMFKDLRAWELCFVVSSNCDDEALLWMLQNLNVPLARYTDACWTVRYQGVNAFGESVQGPLFYVPGRARMNWAESVRKQGGVCGSLSHFGAVAARAHGIPAYTAGQPGHCAYAVRHARGKWVGGFGGPDGSPHFSPWGWNYAHILALEDAFADDAKADRAKRHLWQSSVPGSPTRARAALALATAATPAFIPAWKARIDLLLKDPSVDRGAWERLYGEMAQAFGRNNRPLSEALAAFEGKVIAGLDVDAKLAFALRVQADVGRGVESWSWEMADELLGRHAKWFGDEDRQRLFVQALCLHANSRHFFGKLADWGSKNLGKAADGTPRFTLALAEVVRIKAASLGADALRDLTKQAILSAEQARSLSAFEASSDAARAFAARGEARGDLSAPGRLVSDKGLLWLSTTSGWDHPWSHRGVIDGTGGGFHTEREAKPSVTVQLREGVELASVVVEKTRGNEGRLRKARLETSVDGATWFEIAATDNCPDIWKVDLSGQGKRARWVRLVAENGEGDYLHLRSFLIRAQ